MSPEYAALYKTAEWQRKSRRICERDGYVCQECGDDKSAMQAHHCWRAKGGPCATPDEFLTCLCGRCHKYREDYEHEIKKHLGAVFRVMPGGHRVLFKLLLENYAEGQCDSLLFVTLAQLWANLRASMKKRGQWPKDDLADDLIPADLEIPPEADGVSISDIREPEEEGAI